ncbi:MAG TPA: hypothetical protein VJU84_14740 [Pyrinomonadaceae bacterium]|nr:hypothetical protein [Pyrinomonadaceae bacterium]
MNQNYDYFNDGLIKFVHNTNDSNFDRSYSYDQLGRLTRAASGGSARQDSGGVPYFETFAFDVFSNTLSRFTLTWSSRAYSDSGTYTNGRRSGWGYDADGRIKTIDTREYHYDASGQPEQLTGQVWNGVGYDATSITSGFDGDGNRIKEVSSSPTPVTIFYLRSSVLGNAAVQEIHNGGQTVGYVYTPAGQVLVKHDLGPIWKHITPANTGQYEIYQSGFVNRVEFDAVGADVALTPAEVADSGEGKGDVDSGLPGSSLDSRFSDLSNPAAGCVSYVNGIPLPCSWMGRGSLSWLEVSFGLEKQQPQASISPRWVRPQWRWQPQIENPFSEFNELEVLTTNASAVRPGHWETFGLTPLGGPAVHNPQNPLPTHEQVRNLKPTSEQQQCSDYLARLFGGNGAQAGANGFTPSGDYRGAYTYNGQRLSGHLSDHAIHISGSRDQTKDTDVFVPLGGNRTLSTSDSDGNTVDLFHYRNLNGLGSYTLAVLHLDRSSPQNVGGRQHVGRTGGPGGEGANDRHVHIELLKGRRTTFPKPAIRGPWRTNLSVLCPGR